MTVFLGLGARSAVPLADLVAAVDAGLAQLQAGAGLARLQAGGAGLARLQAGGAGLARLQAGSTGFAAAGMRVAAVATLDRRAGVVRPLAERLGLPLILFTDEELAGMDTPHTVRLTGAPSVAEAAALRAAGPGAALLLPKTGYRNVTVAIAR